MGTYTGTVSFSADNSAYGDGDESDFAVLLSGSISLDLTEDSFGNVSGTGSMTGSVGGSTSSDTDGDDDTFNDNAAGSATDVFGTATGGVTADFQSTDASNFSEFQGTFSDSGQVLSGTLTVSDINLGQSISTSVTLQQSSATPITSLPAQPGAQSEGSLTDSIGGAGVDAVIAPFLQFLLKNFGKSAFSFLPSSLPKSLIRLEQFLGQEVHGNALPWGDVGSAATATVLGNLISAGDIFYNFFKAGMAAYHDGLSSTQAELADVKVVEACGTFLTGQVIENGAVAAYIEPLVGVAAAVVGAEAAPIVVTAGILGLVGFAIVHVGNYLVNGQPAQAVDGIDVYGPQSIMSQGESDFNGPSSPGSSRAATLAPAISFANSISTYGGQAPQAAWSYDADNATFAWLAPSTTPLTQSASQMGITEDSAPLDITGGSGNLITGGPDGDHLTGAGSDEIIAGPGTNVINGGGSGNFIEAGTGNNTITGGGSGNIFAFTPGGGVSTITDFSVSGGDQIDLTAFPNFHSFAQISPDIGQSGANTVITLGPGNMVTLDNVAQLSLSGSQFVFAPLPGNLNGDGASDLLMTDSNNGALLLDQVSSGVETYQQIGGVGAEWQFEGSGSFLGDGTQGELLWDNQSGAMVVAEDHGGSAQYAAIGGVGPQWQFEGTGPILGQSTDDFLIWNDQSGAIVVGAVSGGSVQYAAIGGVGPNWHFGGVGDFLGDGTAGFLIEDSSSGAVVVGEDVNGAAQYTLVGGLGPQWQFEGTGDLLGDGEDGFLIWNNSTGALVAGEVSGGAAQYTQVGAVGPEWQFLGVGNFDGASNSEFMMHSTSSGALVIGTIANGTASYTAVGGVGPEWNFHASNPATLT